MKNSNYNEDIFSEELDSDKRYANGIALEDWEEECPVCGNPKDMEELCSYCFPDEIFEHDF